MRRIVDNKDHKKFYDIQRSYTTDEDESRFNPDEPTNIIRNYLYVLRHGPATYEENYDRHCVVNVERFEVFTPEHATETHDGRLIFNDFLVRQDIGQRINEILTAKEFELSAIFKIVLSLKNEITDEEVAGLVGATVQETEEEEDAS